MKYLFFSFFPIVASLLLFSFKTAVEHVDEGVNAVSIENIADSIIINLPDYKSKGLHIIKDAIDLQGKTWYLPSNLTLRIEGGLIKNGTIVGNNTVIDYNGGAIFDKVHIEGKWKVREISTSMFVDLSYENALKDVFALSSPDVNNIVKVDHGCYVVSAVNNYDHCIDIASNTTVTIDGIILLTPNSHEGYSILHVNGSNILINGKGSIVGDKRNHLGSVGEWGMGINIFGGQGITVRGISVKDCWGDCIYISGKSKNINIEGCLIDHGRRQGISIISAENVIVKDCVITNVRGTAPQYAIDVEPNTGDMVDRVYITNVSAINCQGGIMSYGRAEKAMIGYIEVRNCTIKGSGFNPIYFQKGKRVLVDRCSIVDNSAKDKIVCDGIEDVIINNNIISIGLNQSSSQAIIVGGEKVKRINNNKIF